MHVVLGATGHVGGAVTDALLAAGQPVLAVVHAEAHAGQLKKRGAETAVVDVRDSGQLAAVLRRGRRAFLLNPPADPAKDTDAAERETAAAIAAALAGSGLEKVVVASTYGAQPGEAIGDLSVLYGFEQQVRRSGVPAAINRAAYYFTNFDGAVAETREGRLSSLYPRDLQLPMVSPRDIGRAAAERLQSPVEDDGIRHVEGPRRYSHADVAAAFAGALGRDVRVVEIPRSNWEAHFRGLGFSAAAARAYARMTAVSLDGDFDRPEHPVRSETTLDEHVAALLRD